MARTRLILHPLHGLAVEGRHHFRGVTVGGRDAHPIGRRDGTTAGEGVRAREGRADTCQAGGGGTVATWDLCLYLSPSLSRP